MMGCSSSCQYKIFCPVTERVQKNEQLLEFQTLCFWESQVLEITCLLIVSTFYSLYYSEE